MIGLFCGSLTEEKNTFADHGKTLIFYKFKEFAQVIVILIANDNNFIACLCEKGLELPAPENVFPDRNWGCYGSLQGDMAFWLDVYWRLFLIV
ncbi:hypothetical protein [Enterobacter sp. R4-368]|uniref:hypothetical protein n=1 Tax=Enterobacter sp. R4-368 TaxID=1166130 RepID=UPI00167B92C5|nr:hypothetical protein [Enterobacter sp. R4-368]